MVDSSRRKMMDITNNLRFRIKTTNNETYEAIVDTIHKSDSDDIGALYYVIAVVLIYGLSIVMMIASHIRKNKQDNQLRNYLKEMSLLRKKDRREKIFTRVSNISINTKSTVLNSSNNDEKCIIDSPVQATETDDELRDVLLRKNSNSDDTNDSVFQMPCDDSVETSKGAETPKQDTRTNVKIQVINELLPM